MSQTLSPETVHRDSRTLPEWQKRELDESLAEYTQNPGDVQTWDEFRRELLADDEPVLGES